MDTPGKLGQHVAPIANLVGPGGAIYVFAGPTNQVNR